MNGMIRKKQKNKKADAAMQPKKKLSRTKRKNMQELFPFTHIGNDSAIYMEDGRCFIFLRINANVLNFLNYTEIEDTMNTLGKSFDRNKVKLAFFIQDDTVDMRKSVQLIEDHQIRVNNFCRVLGNEMIDMIESYSTDISKKANYLRAEISSDDLKRKKVSDIIAKLKQIFDSTLSLSKTSRSELMRMLAIYGNRLFSQDLHESEYENPQAEHEAFLFETDLRQKKKQPPKLPILYEFKDLILPNTITYNSERVITGSTYRKHYVVSYLPGNTANTSLLSEITSLKGITTKIFMEDLSLRKYRNYLRMALQVNRATIEDEMDRLDAALEEKQIAGSYTHVQENKEQMYYISMIFQLCAPSARDLEELEEHFLGKCDDAGLSIDMMQTLQFDLYQSVSPLGDNQLANLIKQNIPSSSAANLYPFSSSNMLDAQGLPIGHITDHEDRPVLFNLLADRGLNNNVLVVGTSGIGKTVLMMLLLQNECLVGSYIRNIDVEGTYIKFFDKLGGLNFDMAGNNEYAINPLQIRIPDTQKRGLVDDYISEVVKWISIYKSQWTQRTLDVFQTYLSKTYRKFGITNESDLSSLRNTDYPRLQDVYETLMEDMNNFSSGKMIVTEEDLREILIGLSSCIDGGADAKLFNRYTYLGDQDFEKIGMINFDLSDMKEGALAKRLAQWTNIFTYIGQFANANMDRTKRIVVGIDELHSFLKPDFLPIVDIISDYERRFRKYLTAFLKSTQTIDEMTDTEDRVMTNKAKPLFSLSAIKFMYHLGDVDYESVKSLLGLKNREKDILRESRNGKCLMKIGNQTYDITVYMPNWFKLVKPDA